MAEIVNEESGMERSVEGILNGRDCQSREALAKWRTSDQVENGTPSTSPPYWDTDDDDDDEYGPKPSELYGKFTWKIDKFSETNKRELRSNAFEIGGYKWYILIYPQGCDVCNHLSLFLCVANHDKLLPGWSHFAQFTIAVVNKDPKKSKYSDTLHRFWKKEHDWGWKKFMELPKLQEGFIDESDSLTIKAQVQVIRERANRPFRCLDCQYRRELVRVYLTNVEQICRRFVEERRSKLGRLIEDKARWSSFCAFWLGMDQHSRRRMSREKVDVILKVVVKHFFIEKEVTSTLVMDSLYSGLKALEGQTKNKKGRARLLDAEEMPAPIVSVDKDMFALVDDVLLLLERAALEPLPPKDDKGPQNRTKDGNSGEDFNKEAIERDEKRLTELGRRTVEIFVLAHIFSNKIEVAYQEAIALKRQEELIREEAAWLAESEQKGKRGAAEKEKKSKKKQAKQKRNKSKGKDKRREEKVSSVTQDKHHEENHCNEEKDSFTGESESVLEKPGTFEDVSDVSDSGDGSTEILQPDSEDRDGSPVNWDTDTSEVHHPRTEGSSSGISSLLCVQNDVSDKKSHSVMDDSSSTCSNDSVPSVVINGYYKGNSLDYQIQKLPSRGKNSRVTVTCDISSLKSEADNKPSAPSADVKNLNQVSQSCKAGESESEVVSSLQDPKKMSEHHPVKKILGGNLLQKKPNMENSVDTERPKEKTDVIPSSPKSPPKHLSSETKPDSKTIPNMEAVPTRKASLNGPQPSDQTSSSSSSTTVSQTVGPKPEIQKSKPTEKPLTPPIHVISRPSSAPLIPPPRPAVTVVSVVQTAPSLARSFSSVGRLGLDTSPPTQSYVPHSYRNAIVGNAVGSSGFNYPNPQSQSAAYSQPPPISAFYQPAFPVDVVNRDVLASGTQWTGNWSCQKDASISLNHDTRSVDQYLSCRSRDKTSSAIPAGHQTQGLLTDEFPHLDIINELLEDEHAGNAVMATSTFHVPQLLNYPYARFPGADLCMSSGEMSSCMFDRSRSYQGDGPQQTYRHFNSLGEFTPQASSSPYANGHNNGFVPRQWQSVGLDLSLLAMRNSDADGYPYFGLGSSSSNLSSNIDGYKEFRPSSGY